MYLLGWKHMKKGFTLVELSIVLIIIGLLVTGVAGGTALIKQAESRRVISAIFEAQQAYNGFVGIYDAVPGDMVNASNIWPTCGASATACNGNGNGNIDYTFDAATDERLKIFKHLELAGLLNVGVPQLSDSYTDPVVYSPKITNDLGYNFMPATFKDASGISTYIVPDPTYILMVIGQARVGSSFFGGMNYNSGFTPAEAYAIDHKIDDGAYDGTNFIGLNSGKVWAAWGADRLEPSFPALPTDCAVLNTSRVFLDPGASYTMSTQYKACILAYVIRGGN